ncbi:MAG: hypothetical protein ACMXYK_03645 [Candidatus Woesearchaeota archaeon]
MVKKNSTYIEAHKIEKGIMAIILFLAFFGGWVFVLAIQNEGFRLQAIIIEMFIVILIAILLQTAILVKLMERIM